MPRSGETAPLKTTFHRLDPWLDVRSTDTYTVYYDAPQPSSGLRTSNPGRGTHVLPGISIA